MLVLARILMPLALEQFDYLICEFHRKTSLALALHYVTLEHLTELCVVWSFQELLIINRDPTYCRATPRHATQPIVDLPLTVRVHERRRGLADLRDVVERPAKLFSIFVEISQDV